MNPFNERLKFILEIDKMKHIERRTLITDSSRHENDAEHSFHIAVMAASMIDLAAEKEKIDVNRVVKMLIVHDLIEIYAGDTFAYDVVANADKTEREQKAADKLYSMLPKEIGTELRLLWEEFDKMQTPDSRYAAALDRLQPFIHNINTNYHTWYEGNVTKEQIYKRIGIVKTAIPSAWQYVESSVNKAIEEGAIK